MKINIKIISFIIVAIIALTLLIGLVAYDVLDNTISKSNAEEFLGATFPNSATNFTLSFNSFLDASLRVKFDLPSSDYEILRNYLNSICSNIDLTSEFNPYPIDNDWWTPSQAEIFEGGQCRDVQNRNFRVLVDKTNLDIYTIFLSAS